MHTQQSMAAQAPRSRDYTSDARRDLGDAGTTFGDVYAYAYCKRERAYHVTKLYMNRADTLTRYDVCERPNGVTRSGVRLRWPMRIGHKRAGARSDVRTVSLEPGHFAQPHDARVRALKATWTPPSADVLARYEKSQALLRSDNA